MTCKFLLAALLVASPAYAGDADVIGATARRTARGVYDLDVTVRSQDTGWDRYADAIEVRAPDGTLLATRILEHPHETEQPFTRDVPRVAVPGGVSDLRIRARFKPTGFNGAEFGLHLNDR